MAGYDLQVEVTKKMARSRDVDRSLLSASKLAVDASGLLRVAGRGGVVRLALRLNVRPLFGRSLDVPLVEYD
jgi:hypothetical protein